MVGAGPAGSSLALSLARDGAHVTLFDPSHPREKPCGGGLTRRTLQLLPKAPADDPLPARWVDRCRLECASGNGVEIPFPEPLAIVARGEFDAWLLRRAVAQGVRHVPARVVAVEKPARLRLGNGIQERFDMVVGADGAGSLVRRALLGPTPPGRLLIGAGWRMAGDHPMTIRFFPGLAGYAWLFPRAGHVGVGICAPLGRLPTCELLARLETLVKPGCLESGRTLYAHTIPCPSPDPRSVLEIAGASWALVGDAAALADPITGEGIYFGLRSAALLAETLREDGSAARYPERALEDFGRELLKAAAIRERFYAPGFTDRLIDLAARSASVRGTLGDLIRGRQGYLGLKRRLLLCAPRVLVESALARLFPSAGSAEPR